MGDSATVCVCVGTGNQGRLVITCIHGCVPGVSCS